MNSQKAYKIGLILMAIASILALFDFGVSDKKVEMDMLSSEIVNDNNLAKVELVKILSESNIEKREVSLEELETVERLFVIPIHVKTVILRNIMEDYVHSSNTLMYFLVIKLILLLVALGFVFYSFK